ncbi:MAG TPA: hypothetical protein VHE78_02645 [Gemmatimonadaceae bacterium]|nr:hypothetical protein [Gemmatimonadaceae bacterium]
MPADGPIGRSDIRFSSAEDRNAASGSSSGTSGSSSGSLTGHYESPDSSYGASGVSYASADTSTGGAEDHIATSGHSFAPTEDSFGTSGHSTREFEPGIVVAPGHSLRTPTTRLSAGPTHSFHGLAGRATFEDYNLYLNNDCPKIPAIRPQFIQLDDTDLSTAVHECPSDYFSNRSAPCRCLDTKMYGSVLPTSGEIRSDRIELTNAQSGPPRQLYGHDVPFALSKIVERFGRHVDDLLHIPHGIAAGISKTPPPSTRWP